MRLCLCVCVCVCVFVCVCVCAVYLTAGGQWWLLRSTCDDYRNYMRDSYSYRHRRISKDEYGKNCEHIVKTYTFVFFLSFSFSFRVYRNYMRDSHSYRHRKKKKKERKKKKKKKKANMNI